jgi:hypothetical protein
VGVIGRAPLRGEDPVSVRGQRLHGSPLAVDLALDDDSMRPAVGRAAPDLDAPVLRVGDEGEAEREDRAGLAPVVDVVAALSAAAVDVVARRARPAEIQAGLVLRRREGPIAQLVPDEECDATPGRAPRRPSGRDVPSGRRQDRARRCPS